jgi:hypothetical protein
MSEKSIAYACKIYIRHFKHLHVNFEQYQPLGVEKNINILVKMTKFLIFEIGCNGNCA